MSLSLSSAVQSESIYLRGAHAISWLGLLGGTATADFRTLFPPNLFSVNPREIAPVLDW